MPKSGDQDQISPYHSFTNFAGQPVFDADYQGRNVEIGKSCGLAETAAPGDVQMRWAEKFLDQLDEALEWQSPGTMSWRFHDDENWLRLAPSLVELVGGADDGEAVYPFYFLHVSHLIEIFDELPEMSWNTMNNEFSLEGKIDGDDAWITFSSSPFDDEEPQDVLDPKGGIRKKMPPKE